MGVSFNKPEKNAEWAVAERYAFELWTDADKALALHYGAVGSKMAPVPGRITVILDDEGELVLRYDSVDVGTHPADVLEDLRELSAR